MKQPVTLATGVVPILLAAFVQFGMAITPVAAAEDAGGPAMDVIGFARAPVGFVAFCTRYPTDCAADKEPRRIVLTSQSIAELDRVNRLVNGRVQPVTDLALYGKTEYWAYPVDKGDCEDYVLLKRKMLIQTGWPASALLITVVRDQADEGHAVLTVVSDKGDYILDNQRDGVLPWRATVYDYIKRQSQTDPKAWVFVGTAKAGVGVASTR
jgi:predicted transglutaminase-like cysteine proteinase